MKRANFDGKQKITLTSIAVIFLFAAGVLF